MGDGPLAMGDGPLAAKCVAAGLAGWFVWWKLVLQPAARSTRTWGPRWLAVALSSVLNSFGSLIMTHSHDVEDSLKAGHWKPGSQYMFVWHPHGIFAISALYFVSNWWARSYPGGDIKFVLVAPNLLCIPGLAEFLLLCNARLLDRRTFEALLAKGATVAVQPGGIAEQLEVDCTAERAFFPRNLGFVRLALKYNVPVMPVYAFGENQLYRTSGRVRALNKWLHSRFGTGALFLLGQGGMLNSPVLPNPGMLPHFRAGMHIRLGEPASLGPKNEDPSDEQVSEAFDNYVVGLRKLFDKHKDDCLPAEVAAKGLEIIVRQGGSRGGK